MLKYIAGPCAAETEQQVLAVAQALQPCKIDFFRAGLWKPRTSPHSFQGVGERGIEWMTKARDMFGLKICTEVATTQHVQLCRDAGFDALWIGARTVSDPFAVQALCDSLKGYAGVVMVKNPISADVDLWIGAISRLRKVGIENIVAVHRGVNQNAYQNGNMRNDAAWVMPIELKRTMPDIPVVCDPSHITGNAALVPIIAQQAMQIGLDGLMIEVHCNPHEALSDAMQQLTPEQYRQLIDGLNVRTQNKAEKDLLQMREQINEIDNQIWALIEQRMTISKHIGEIKQQHNMPVLQPERYQHILHKRLQWARQHNIEEQLVNTIMQAIHEASVKKQIQ